MQEYISVGEYAARTGLSTGNVRMRISNGKLKSKKVKGKRLVVAPPDRFPHIIPPRPRYVSMPDLTADLPQSNGTEPAHTLELALSSETAAKLIRLGLAKLLEG